ncbi:MAG: LacI family DNA-binding transcriptional regulator [Candidatus Omnitrophota bacterium]
MKSNPKRTSIYDVAERSGVSVATVCRVMNNGKYVREETRKKVIQTIETLNYVPNPVARLLVKQNDISRKKTTVLLCLGKYVTATHSYFSGMIYSIEKILSEYDFSLSITHVTDAMPYQLPDMPRMLIDGEFIAAILLGDIDNNIYKFITGVTKNIVVLDVSPKFKEITCVKNDDIGGALISVKHLIDLGHRSIGIIIGPEENSFSMDILQGYKNALETSDIPYISDNVVRGEAFDSKNGYLAARSLLEKGDVTAIFTNDDMALGVIKAAREKGVNIPRDLSIVGFDDSPFAEYTDPPLTTVRVDKLAIGRIGAETLISMIRQEGESRVRHIIFPSELVIRNSTDSVISRDAL